MTYKLLTIAAMSLSLGATTALVAESGTTGMSGMQSDRMPSAWEGAIADAFYSDTEHGTLRSGEEMRTNWDGLGDADKNAVRDYCDSVARNNDQARMGTGGDMSSGAITESGTTAGVDTSTRTGSTSGLAGTAGDASGAMHHASLQQICQMVE